MKYYMYVNPYNETSCMSHAPTTFSSFVMDCDIEEQEELVSQECIFFESAGDQNGPWIQVEVVRSVQYQITPFYSKKGK